MTDDLESEMKASKGSIATQTYKGETIAYDRDDDLWVCQQLGIKDAKLSMVQRKIDERSLAARKINFEVLLPDKSNWSHEKTSYKKVRVTTTLEGRDSNYCWVTNGKERDKVRIDSLVPVECEDKVQKWVTLQLQAEAAAKAADKALDALPTFDAESLKAAAKLEMVND
jgi:hypothetical protein